MKASNAQRQTHHLGMAQKDLVAVTISNSRPAVRRLLRAHNFKNLKELSKSQLVLEDFEEDLNQPALQAIMSKLDAVQLAQERQQKVQFAAPAEPETITPTRQAL